MRKISRCAWALVLVGCSFVNLARAEEDTPRPVAEPGEVLLKNGTSMRGTIVAVEPGQRVIVIVAGAQSIIPWGEVARIVGGAKDAGTTTTITPPTQATTPETPVMGMPRLHIDSSWPELELSRVDGEIGGGYHHNSYNQVDPHALIKYLCRAPCDKLVDGREGHRFLISGPGMLPSNSFRLDTFDGNVTARVHGVTVARYFGGVTSVAVGSMFGLGATLFIAASFATTGTPTAKNPDPERTARDVRTFGFALAGIGVAMAVTGIVRLSAGRTRVELIKSARGGPALLLDNGVLRF